MVISNIKNKLAYCEYELNIIKIFFILKKTYISFNTAIQHQIKTQYRTTIVLVKTDNHMKQLSQHQQKLEKERLELEQPFLFKVILNHITHISYNYMKQKSIISINHY